MMRVDNNKLYDVLRDYATKYAEIREYRKVWDSLYHLGHNETVESHYNDYDNELKIAKETFYAMKNVCELQKDEEEEINEILHFKLDSHEILRLLAYWLRDMEYAEEFFNSSY